MSRLPIVVRTASPEDAAAMIEVWSQCNGHDLESHDSSTAVGVRRCPALVETAEAIAEQNSDPDRQLFVALLDGIVIGAIALQRQLLSAIQTTRGIVVTDLQVMPRHRRRLVASTLLAAAVTWAEEADCEVLMTSSPVQSREANRFLTRLGFGQVAMIRGAEVSALRSRFASMATSSKDTGRLIAVRRTMRRRQGRGRLRPGTQV